MEAELTKSTRSTGPSAVGRGLATALGTAALTVSAAVAAAVLAQRFGRTAETDGLFAAYAVYLVVVLAAQASRLVVLPRLARAAGEGRLGAEVGGYAAALALLAVPVLGVALAAPGWAAGLLTGDLPDEARDTAAAALVWLVPAGVAQLYTALAASALAARDSYGVAALAYGAGALAGLGLFLGLLDEGPVALAIGVALSGGVSLGLLLATLILRGELAPRRLEALRLGSRLWELARGAALPLALQGLYVVAVRFAAELGVGAVTTFAYAYFVAAFLVAVTASSLALVSSAPLARARLTGAGAAAHVVNTSWLSLSLVAAAAGFFVLAGESIARGVLGEAFSGPVGDELGRLVAYLSPWMVASIGVSVTFPLLFVAGRERLLPALALVALALHVPLEWALKGAWALEGVAVGLALTTLLVLAALLAILSRETLVRAFLGLGRLTAASGALAAASFGLLALALDAVPAAVAGLAVYGAALLVWRPRGLRAAWAYVRALS